MKIVKKTSEYTIKQRRDERYAVTTPKNKPVNGEEKIKILLAEGLIKLTEPAAQPEPEVEETPAEESVDEAEGDAAE